MNESNDGVMNESNDGVEQSPRGIKAALWFVSLVAVAAAAGAGWLAYELQNLNDEMTSLTRDLADLESDVGDIGADVRWLGWDVDDIEFTIDNLKDDLFRYSYSGYGSWVSMEERIEDLESCADDIGRVVRGYNVYSVDC